MNRGFWLVVILTVVFSSPSWAQEEECMVIGDHGNPQKAQELFSQALSLWNAGKEAPALEKFEGALIEDRSVLSNDDRGMGMALIRQYRQKKEKGQSSTGLLCRLGYFENIISGNLEDSVARYWDAAKNAKSEKARLLARNEAVRLTRELEYIKGWYSDHLKEVHSSEAKDLQEFLATQKMEEKKAQLLSLEEDLQQLVARKAYLKNQERETQGDLAGALTRKARYHRNYYNYTGVASPPEENLDFVNNPTPSMGDEADLQVPADSPAPRSGETDLNNYYSSKNNAREIRDKLSQIRTELQGLEKREKILEKQIQKFKLKNK